MKALCSSINNNGFTRLVMLIQCLCSQSGTHTCPEPQSGTRTCPEPYRDFLSELSRNNPTCALVQLRDYREAIHSLTTAIQRSVDVQDTYSHYELLALQSHVPVIAEFVCKCPKTPDGKLPGDLCSIVEHIKDTVQQKYSHPLPPPSHYPPTTSDNDHWSFFPNLPLVRRKEISCRQQHHYMV